LVVCAGRTPADIVALSPKKIACLADECLDLPFEVC